MILSGETEVIAISNLLLNVISVMHSVHFPISGIWAALFTKSSTSKQSLQLILMSYESTTNEYVSVSVLCDTAQLLFLDVGFGFSYFSTVHFLESVYSDMYLSVFLERYLCSD